MKYRCVCGETEPAMFFKARTNPLWLMSVCRTCRVLLSRHQALSKQADWSSYETAKLRATPNWLSKDQLHEIASIYKLCRDYSKDTNEPHEVDHVVPLRGKNVCGLHVPWNLQIISKAQNRSKKNKVA